MLLVSGMFGTYNSWAKEGIYMLMSGPQFEIPAELYMLKLCGVDAVW